MFKTLLLKAVEFFGAAGICTKPASHKSQGFVRDAG